jgi:DNA repair exonuclease SbcCD ATPase subunit
MPRLGSLICGLAFFGIALGSAFGEERNATASSSGEPPGKTRLKDLTEDADVQSRIENLDKQREEVWRQIYAVKAAAQRFRLAKARYEEIMAAGECYAAATAFEQIEFHEGEHRKLEASLNEQCGKVERSTGALAQACADERKSIQQDITELREERSALEKKCPSLLSH